MNSKLFLVGTLLVGAILSGCSTNEVKLAERPQYCNTSSTKVLKDGTTSSSTILVECSDDQVRRVVERRMGIAPNCGVFTYWGKKGGYDVQRKGISCQKPDGSWEIINTSGY